MPLELQLYNLSEDPAESNNLYESNPKIVKQLNDRVTAIGKERPALKGTNRLMTPALPWVYGQKENATVADWVKQEVQKIRKNQPQKWPRGKTPWPQAPKDGKIIYTGDGR